MHALQRFCESIGHLSIAQSQPQTSIRNKKMNDKFSTLTLINDPEFYPGYMFGFDQPCIVFKLKFNVAIEQFWLDCRENIIQVDQAVRSLIRPSQHTSSYGSEEKRIDYLAFWIRSLIEHYGYPIFNEPKIRPIKIANQIIWAMIFPCLDRTPMLAAFQIGLKAMLLAHGINKLPDSAKAELADLMKAKDSELRSYALTGFNMLHFLSEANNLGIPWFRYSSDIFQLGYGANSRLLRSSITDRTSNISVGIARDKQKTNNLLRAAGLPVPAQAVVASAERAVQVGRTIGYPVVVKPADLDGGVGVGALLQDDESVRAAFSHASGFSKHIVIEKYIEGNDYRILVVNDQVLGVLERAHGGVTGDGKQSVRNLIDIQNQERANAKDDRRFLHPIKPDHEAERMLLHAGFAWDDVPPKGKFVRLRAAANVASGGIPTEILVTEMHTDNLMLARRVARTLRLDVAGIDLLMVDIRKSWLECGAGICEVNAQPQMFTTLHAPMLRALLPDRSGRIPIVVVLTAAVDCEFSESLYRGVLSLYPNAGWVSNKMVKLAGRQAAAAGASLFDSSRSLLLDTALEALVISVSDGDILSSGWPIDRCDALIFVGGGTDFGSAQSPDLLKKIGQSAKGLRPKKIFAERDDAACNAVVRQLEWIRKETESGRCEHHLSTREEMPRLLIDYMCQPEPT